MKTTLLVALVATLTFAAGCTTEERRGPEDIKFDIPKFNKIAIHEIQRDGETVGRLETVRIVDDDNIDSNDREQMFVVDDQGGRIGVITDDMKAYRFRAHGRNVDMVSATTDLPTAVRAVFGWTSGTVTLKRL